LTTNRELWIASLTFFWWISPWNLIVLGWNFEHRLYNTTPIYPRKLSRFWQFQQIKIDLWGDGGWLMNIKWIRFILLLFFSTSSRKKFKNNCFPLLLVLVKLFIHCIAIYCSQKFLKIQYCSTNTNPLTHWMPLV